jgi:hypothetical protein
MSKFYNLADVKQNTFTFYQIAQFKNPYTNLYEVRKVVMDKDGNVVHTFDKQYTKEILEKYMQNNPNSKFSVYPVYDIGLVGLPSSTEICILLSPLINAEVDMKNNFEDSKFAPF